MRRTASPESSSPELVRPNPAPVRSVSAVAVMTRRGRSPRVAGIAPMVYDNLNIPVQMKHQIASWGKYSAMIDDYTRRGLQAKLNTKVGQKLSAMVDPYTYRRSIKVPTLIVNGGNDPYWTVDGISRGKTTAGPPPPEFAERATKAGIAAKSRAKASPPSDGPPKSTSAISGKSARGIPKTIAMMSTTNVSGPTLNVMRRSPFAPSDISAP